MNFRDNGRSRDDVEINLIPLIDVLLVILIFLAATTSFAHFTRLRITLPQAAAEQQESAPLQIAISQDGHYALNGNLIDGSTTADIARALAQAAQGQSSPLLMINADAQATHQSVVNVMEAARQAGIVRLNFAAQTGQ